MKIILLKSCNYTNFTKINKFNLKNKNKIIINYIIKVKIINYSIK